MTPIRIATGLTTVASAGRSRSVICRKVPMVWPMAETRSNSRSAWLSQTVAASTTSVSANARSIRVKMYDSMSRMTLVRRNGLRHPQLCG